MGIDKFHVSMFYLSHPSRQMFPRFLSLCTRSYGIFIRAGELFLFSLLNMETGDAPAFTPFSASQKVLLGVEITNLQTSSTDFASFSFCDSFFLRERKLGTEQSQVRNKEEAEK